MGEASASGLGTVGWREWVSLPDLGIPWIKCKVDTGARTSAIHATELEVSMPDGIETVSFEIHPWQDSDADPVRVTAPVLEHREIRSSNGELSLRPVVRTTIGVGPRSVQADLTLARRYDMGFRMLLGRKALSGTFLIDPAHSYLQGRPPLDVRDRNRGRGGRS